MPGCWIGYSGLDAVQAKRAFMDEHYLFLLKMVGSIPGDSFLGGFSF
jgi:hypothetical protein